MSRSRLSFGCYKCREVKCLLDVTYVEKLSAFWMLQMSRSKLPSGCHKCREVKCFLDVTNVEK
jgi:hypothetical protein